MFRCTAETYLECINLNLFGQQEIQAKDVLQVCKGDILFLNKVSKQSNIIENFIEGPFYADSNGSLNINSDAWSGRFPAQVKVKAPESLKRIFHTDYNNFINLPVHDKMFYPIHITIEVGLKLLKALNVEYNSSVNNLSIPEQEIVKVDKDFRKKYPAEYRCEDGHYVRSLSEVVIDNWLYNKGYIHSYEKRLPINENLYSDFYLKEFNVYIEFWGLQEEEYKNRKKIKIDLYNKNKYRLINLDSSDIKDIDTILEKEIIKFKY
jgi:hypothetical protein